MTIVICTRKFTPPFIGGVDVYADRLGRALQRLGHEVVFLAIDGSAAVNDNQLHLSEDSYGGSRIRRLQFAFSGRPQQSFDLAYDPQVGRAVHQVLQEEQPDLFIVMNFYTITLAVVEAARALAVPVVHVATDFLPVCRRATLVRWNGRSCQVGESVKSCAACFVSSHPLGRLAAAALDPLPEETILRLANRPAAQKLPHPLALLKPYWKQAAIMEERLKILRPLRQQIDLILTPTQYTYEMFLANGFTADQLRLLPFAVEPDHQLADVRPVPADHTRFLFVGRLQPYKGVHLLVEAFNQLQSPRGATLTVYGVPGGHERYFNNLCDLMAASERVHFAGKIAPTDLDQAFAKADYFILPSTWHENSPLILLDALQSRTPVIASQIGGITDLVHDGVNGLLFPVGDAHALQQQMQRVIDRPELRQQLQSGIDLPDIDNYARQMLAFCET